MGYPPQRRQRMHEAIKQVLLATSTEQPLCLILEDLHWIDAHTQAVVDLIAESITGARILLLVNYRPEYQHGWGNRSNYTHVRLDPLPMEDIEELLVILLGSDSSLDAVKEMLRTRTEGNPLFIEECARALAESQSIIGEISQYRLGTTSGPFALPPTVQAVIATRMDRLSPEERTVLQSAAVIGKDVRVGILRSIAGVSDEAFDAVLQSLRRAEFMHETRAYPDLEYTFKHVLTHEVVYDSLLPEKRRELHARIVDAIERLHHDRLAEHVERLAYHACHGDLKEKAVDYLARAGHKATALSALQDARDWFEQALGVLKALPESRSTLEQAFEIRVALRAVLSPLGEPRSMLEHLRVAETLAERLNDDRRRGWVCAFVMNVQLMLGELDQALATGTRALEIAQALGDVDLRFQTSSNLQMAYYCRGDYMRGAELCADDAATMLAGGVSERAVQYYMSLFGAAASIPSSLLGNWVWLIMSLAELGAFAEAAEREAEVLRIADATHNLYMIGFAHRAASTLWLLKGDRAKACSLTDRWVEVVRKGNIVIQLPTAAAASALALAQVGETREALKLIREGEQFIQRQAARGILVNRGSTYYFLGRACLLLGRLDEARRLAERAIESSTSQLGFAAHALHLLGDIATHLDQFDPRAGAAHYRQALALAEPRGMRPLIAHCHLGLGKLHRRTDERQQAGEHLASATTMYRDMDMKFWLEQAKAELKALG